MAKADRPQAVEPPASFNVGTVGLLEELLDRLEEVIKNARSMPLSASAMVPRQEVMALVDSLREALPQELAHARAVLRNGEGVVERGREEAERLVQLAKQERDRLVSRTEIVQAASREADRLVAAAETHAKRIRADAESYVEGKLATFEVVLQKTLAAVERGRARLGGRLDADALAPEDDQGI